MGSNTPRSPTCEKDLDINDVEADNNGNKEDGDAYGYGDEHYDRDVHGH